MIEIVRVTAVLDIGDSKPSIQFSSTESKARSAASNIKGSFQEENSSGFGFPRSGLGRVNMDIERMV
jgi:hypothetical protein